MPNCRLGEADLRQRGESDVEEHSQAEVVAAEEASRQGLDRERLNVQAWCVGSFRLNCARRAGALCK